MDLEYERPSLEEIFLAYYEPDDEPEEQDDGGANAAAPVREEAS